LNDLVRSHFSKLKDGRPFLSYFQAWISVPLAWWLVPITLFLFWGRYLRRHDFFWTTVHALFLALALCSAVRLYRTAARTLRGNARPAFRLKEVVQRRDTYLRLSVVVIVSAALIAISAGAVYPPREVLSISLSSPRTWILIALVQMGCSPLASLDHADVSRKPPDWLGKKDEELDRVKGADLAHKNLRYAQADYAFLAKANLSGSDLYGISLFHADLRQSNLVDSDLRWAQLSDALMQRAYLQDSRLDHAQLRSTQLKDANLFESSLFNADLSNADLTGADLRLADLRGASFTLANLQGANFSVADLSGVHLELAVIKYADFRGVTAGPEKEGILNSKDWKLAFFRSEMLSQLGLPPDHNEKLEQQMCADPTAVTNEQASFKCSVLRSRSQKAASPDSRQQPIPATGGSPAAPQPQPQPKPKPKPSPVP
jgi:uncharacterized protein YjbI with pentapeptide repeats